MSDSKRALKNILSQLQNRIHERRKLDFIEAEKVMGAYDKALKEFCTIASWEDLLTFYEALFIEQNTEDDEELVDQFLSTVDEFASEEAREAFHANSEH